MTIPEGQDLKNPPPVHPEQFNIDRKVVVTGIGLISALGDLQASWQKLIACQSGIARHQPFSELAPLPLALIDKQPINLTTLTKLVVAAALKDAGLIPPLLDCGVVIGSSRSHQAAWEDLTRHAGKSRQFTDIDLDHWLDILPHMSAIFSARQVGATGPVLAPMAACATGLWALAQGTLLIETGQCQQVIVGAVEAPITPLTIAGFKQMKALAKTGAYPFDRQREGLVLGEGAAVFVLESAQLAKQRAAQIYGQILGFGLTADAYHATTPDPSNKSAIAAVQQCLNRSDLKTTDINYIHAHGTATQINDQNESRLIQYLFPQGIPVSSTKGATGHTLGASGVLGTAFSLLALHHQMLPPCVGLKQPEFDLDLVTTPRPANIQHTLCFSFGFGGQNAVIALGKG